MTNINSNVFNNIQLEPETAPMKKGKAKGWLGEYHWVQLPTTEDNPFHKLSVEHVDWCTEHYGKSGSRWYTNQDRVFFKDEKDMTLFILRWVDGR